uniref:Uncharacterized protein n=1 Tax=Timema cristinae TaxID=61476 RepID=A0A7R9DJV7_TIMCR|nr:unnamed protein product [Timema cristinae]
MVFDPLGSVQLNEEEAHDRKVTGLWMWRFQWAFCWVRKDKLYKEAFQHVAGKNSHFFLNKSSGSVVGRPVVWGFESLPVPSRFPFLSYKKVQIWVLKSEVMMYGCPSSVCPGSFLNRGLEECNVALAYSIESKSSISGSQSYTARHCSVLLDHLAKRMDFVAPVGLVYRVPRGLFSALFRSTDLSPSDFIAGFILLRVKQKRDGREYRRQQLLAERPDNTLSEYKESQTSSCSHNSSRND